MEKICKGLRSPCPVAGALDIVGDRWTLLVVRDMLVFEKKRFDEFLNSPEGIATNILSQRLKWLVENRLAERQPDPDDGRKVIYTLTPRGESLRPILSAMVEWGLESIDGVCPTPG